MSRQSKHVKKVNSEVLLGVLAETRAGNFAARMPLTAERLAALTRWLPLAPADDTTTPSVA